MKRFLRSVALVLAFAMLMAVPAYAQQASTYSSSFFAAFSTYIYVVHGNSFQVWFEVTAVDRMDELGCSSIKLQSSPDGTNWTTVKTFTPDVYTSMIGENEARYDGYVGYCGVYGKYYRAYVTFHAKNSIGTGRYFAYTAPVYLTS